MVKEVDGRIVWIVERESEIYGVRGYINDIVFEFFRCF